MANIFEKSKIREIRKRLLGFLLLASGHFFFSLLVILALVLIIGAALFYKYSILAKKAEPGAFKFIGMEEGAYQYVLRVWQEKEEKFRQYKEYPNPFNKFD